MKASITKLILFAVIATTVGIFFYFDLGAYLSLDFLKSQRDNFAALYDQSPMTTIAVYFVIYVVSTALSFPGATVLTLAGGALFGFGLGLVVVSFASTIGATAAFLMARFFFQGYVQKNFGERLRAINEGIRKEGDFYLFTLRLVPIVPFFVINLAMGLTPIKTWRFFVVSQVGMFLGTAVYVNAGTQLARIDSLSGIMSPEILLSFALLGLFPLVAKKLLAWLKGRRAMRRWKRPRRCDYNVVVIGAGAGGLVSSYIAATVRAKVALIEAHRMGGDCLNTGCVPSKALIKSAKVVAHQHKAQAYGLQKIQVSFDFAEIMERIQRVIKAIEPHDSVERYQGLGVECIQGYAKIKSPFEVEVNGRTLSTKTIIVATGGRPMVPPIEGLDQVPYYTSDTIWDLRQLPKRMVVLGGGPIGVELAQSFGRLGAEVTMVEMADRILNREDPEASALVQKRLQDEGVKVLTGHRAQRFAAGDAGSYRLHAQHAGGSVEIAFDAVLLALGRQANVTGFGLEELGVRIDQRGRIESDAFLATNIPNIYVCGDVSGDLQFTHVAAHEAWFASVNALFGPFKRFRADYRVIPMVTYCEPEVARVGINELEAKAQGIAYETSYYGIDDLDRAIADEVAEGFVKVLTIPGKDQILGVTIVGEHAGEILAEYVLAMKYKIGLNKILGTIHAYPTFAEANKYAAGVWKKAHKPEGLLKYVQTYHRWRRGA